MRTVNGALGTTILGLRTVNGVSDAIDLIRSTTIGGRHEPYGGWDAVRGLREVPARGRGVAETACGERVSPVGGRSPREAASPRRSPSSRRIAAACSPRIRRGAGDQSEGSPSRAISAERGPRRRTAGSEMGALRDHAARAADRTGRLRRGDRRHEGRPGDAARRRRSGPRVLFAARAGAAAPRAAAGHRGRCGGDELRRADAWIGITHSPAPAGRP